MNNSVATAIVREETWGFFHYESNMTVLSLIFTKNWIQLRWTGKGNLNAWQDQATKSEYVPDSISIRFADSEQTE